MIRGAFSQGWTIFALYRAESVTSFFKIVKKGGILRKFQLNLVFWGFWNPENFLKLFSEKKLAGKKSKLKNQNLNLLVPLWFLLQNSMILSKNVSKILNLEVNSNCDLRISKIFRLPFFSKKIFSESSGAKNLKKQHDDEDCWKKSTYWQFSKKMHHIPTCNQPICFNLEKRDP